MLRYEIKSKISKQPNYNKRGEKKKDWGKGMTAFEIGWWVVKCFSMWNEGKIVFKVKWAIIVFFFLACFQETAGKHWMTYCKEHHFNLFFYWVYLFGSTQLISVFCIGPFHFRTCFFSTIKYFDFIVFLNNTHYSHHFILEQIRKNLQFYQLDLYKKKKCCKTFN